MGHMLLEMWWTPGERGTLCVFLVLSIKGVEDIHVIGFMITGFLRVDCSVQKNSKIVSSSRQAAHIQRINVLGMLIFRRYLSKIRSWIL